jgi:hypothetical protein
MGIERRLSDVLSAFTPTLLTLIASGRIYAAPVPLTSTVGAA